MLVLILLFALTSNACGHKGELYLPASAEKQNTTKQKKLHQE